MNTQKQQRHPRSPYQSAFDNTTAIIEYAARYLRHGYMNETVDEAAEQCSLDLMDRSAKSKFKREVQKLQTETQN